MANNNNSNNLRTFGWNFSFIGEISLSTDSDANVYISNLGIESIFSQQLSGEESLSSSTYGLNSQQLLQPYSSNQRIFKQQADGSYQGNSETLTWNVDHYELEANGSKIVFRPDGQLNYVEYSNGYGLSAEYTNNLLTELKDSNGNSFTIGYNSDGRIEKITDSDGLVDTYSYDATGQYLLSVEDANSLTGLSYDNPFDPTLVSSVTYDDGLKVSYDYDHLGRLQQIVYGEGRESISYVYNQNGEITSITDANGEQLIYEYDDNGRLISQQIAGSDQAVNFSYGDAGEVTVTDSDGATVELSTSEQGLILRQSDVLGRLTQFQYDEKGNLTGVNASENFGITYSYDEQGNLISQINPLGDEVKFTYEHNYGRLQTVTDARGNDLSYSYDERGNLTAITYEDGSSENFTVDEKGNTVESVNRRDIAIGYEYNALGQVTRVDYQDGSADTYTYDDAGRLTSTTDASGTTLIEYDADNPNLIAKITYPTGRSLAYTYDDVGRRIQMVDHDGSEVNYSYDDLGRLASLTNETGSLIVFYTYDDAGRLAREDNGNGTYTTYTYDLAGQLLNLANYAADDSVNSSYVYTYDDLGRQISATDLDGEWVYEYDAASQLIGAVFTSTNPEIENQNLTYVYDAAGNRIRTINNGVTTQYQTNDLNQYTNAGTVDYQYDLDGNLTYKSDGVNSWTYSYDDQNRLVGVSEGNGSTTEYEYDIFGNRIATVYNGNRTEYLVDPFGYGDVVSEYDGNGNLTAEYTHGIGLVSRTDNSNVAVYYDFNATGSAVGLTGTGGEVLNRYGYLPYGESLFESESIENSFEFVGQWGIMEEANGLDFMRARFYSPSEGRFLNTDPIGLAGGDTNIYRYVNNNPINLIDPSGLIGIGGEIGGAFGWGLGVGESVLSEVNFKAGLFSKGPGAVASLDRIDPDDPTQYVVGLDVSASAGLFLTTASSATELANTKKSFSVGLGTPFLLKFGINLEVALKDEPSFFPFVITGTVNSGFGITAAIKGTEGDSLPIVPPGQDNPILPGNEFLVVPGIVPPPYAQAAEKGINDAEDIVVTGSPLVLDLDGDGIELTAVGTTNVFFDLDNDGFRELVGWVQPDDGLLVFDRNNDGYINDNSELFGNFTTSGFVELRAIDSNSDGIIDAADNNFSDLQIWRDLDTDGRSDPNELYSLAELDITRISAVADDVYILNAGNEIKETTFYELGDGTTREIVDAWLTIDQLNSYYDAHSTYNEPIVFTEQIFNLPNLKGYGNLPDLWIAMAQDPELLELVQSFQDRINSGDVAEGQELIPAILYRWAGVDDVDPATRGKVDAQKLGFLEKFIGRNWQNSSDDNLGSPGGVAQFAAVNRTFDELLPELEIRLLVQAADSPVDYNTVTESYVFDLGLTEALEQLREILTQAETAPSQTLDSKAIALTQFIRQQGGEYENWLVGKNSDDNFVGQEANEFILGFDGNDSLKGNAGDDTLNGGAGNDSLEGGKGNELYQGGAGHDLLDDGYVQSGQDTLDGGIGNDTLQGRADDDLYLFGRGYGHDVIEDYHSYRLKYGGLQIESGGNDTLRFAEGITRDNLRWNFDGKNLTFTLTDSPDDSLTILNYIEPNYRLENIEVENTLLTIEEIFNLVNEGSSGDDSVNWNQTALNFRGLDGNDTIATGNYDDQLWGDNGNDQLSTKEGNDTLYGGAGDDTLKGSIGNDVYQGGAGNDLLDDGLSGDQGENKDTLDGGTGDDTLKGMVDDDLYLFNKGYGHDIIEDYKSVSTKYAGTFIYSGGNDTLRFGSGITRENLRWNFDGNNLTFTLTDSPNDSLTIFNYKDVEYRVENIEVDADLLTIEEILNSTINKDISGNNLLRWNETPISFQGLAGNDTITTGDGNDKLWGNYGGDAINSGGGHDTLFGNEGNDTLKGEEGNDLYLGGAGDDLLYDGYTQLDQDTLDGGEGNDTLRGGADSDLYLFNKGYGHDVIEDYNQIFSRYVPPSIADGGSNDTLHFGEGITRDSLRWNFDGKNLTFTLTDSPDDSLTILNYIDLKYRLENIEIEDSQLTANEMISSGTWSDTAAANSLKWTDTVLRFKGLDGNDTLTSGNYDDQLWGNDGDDKITTNDGNDTLIGGTGNDSLDSGTGNDILIGSAGDDTLIGSADDDIYYGGTGNDYLDDGYFESGQDTLDGGKGNDTLRGMSDNDLYLFNRGYGHDVIEDYTQVSGRYSAYIGSGGEDTLRFGEGITRNNLRWNFNGQDLIFKLTDSSDDSLTIKNYTNSNYGIENIEVDGSLLTTEEILNLQFTIGEFGQVDRFNHNSQTIQLDHSYLNPVVFALPLSRNGGDPAVVRITDIQSDSFTAYLQETEYKDGSHTNESFSYLVIEAGDWELENGTLLEVGTVDTNKVTSNGWSDLNFDVDFVDTPVILSQVQSNQGSQFVRTRQKQASMDGFSLSMEEEEALKDSGHATETVGWLAMESGTGELGELQYQAGHTANVVNHEGYTLNFETNFDTDPSLYASLASFNGSDSAGLRYRDLSSQRVEIIVEEDQSLDSETVHVNEIVDFLAISGTGDLIAAAYEPS